MRKKVFYFLLSFFCLWEASGNAWGAPFAYITNASSHNVSVIDTAIDIDTLSLHRPRLQILFS